MKLPPQNLSGFDYIPLGLIWDKGAWHTLKWHHPNSAEAKADPFNVYSKSIVTIAPSRSGKLVTQLAQTLSAFHDGGDVIVSDMKGELSYYSLPARAAMGDKCYCFNPFGLHVERAPYMQTCRINPLLELEADTPGYEDGLQAIADGIVREERGSNAFWAEGARNLFRAVADHLRRIHPESASIPEVAEAISARRWHDTLDSMARSESRGAVEVAALYLVKENHTDGLAGQLQTLRSQLRIFDEVPELRAALSGKPDYRIRDLKNGQPKTLYIVLPEGKAKRYQAMTRMLVYALMARAMSDPIAPVLMVLDEAANALGDCTGILPLAVNVGAGYGLRLHTVFQNEQQGVIAFGRENWNSFLSGAGLLQFFTPGVEMETARRISDLFGMTSKLESHPLRPGHEMWRQVPIIQPQDVRGSTHYPLPEDYRGTIPPKDVRWNLLIKEGLAHPIVAGRIPYWHPHWQGFYTERMQPRLT